MIVKDWIKDDVKSQQIDANFKEWHNTDEAKKYWREREAMSVDEERSSTENKESSMTSIVTNNNGLSTATGSSSCTVVPNTSEKIEEFFQKNISQPDDFDSYIVDDINYSKQFYQFQQSIFKQIKKELLTFESNCYQLLAMSSILLLTGNFPAHMISCFPTNTLTSLKVKILKDLRVGSYKFSRTHLIKILDPVQSVTRKETRREVASLSLLNLSVNETGITKKIILMFNNLIMQLPLESQSEDIEEIDLCSRFILPTLQSLFDEQFEDRNVFMKLSNEKNLECQLSQFDISKRRPDGQIRVRAISTNQMSTDGFMEAKKISEPKNHNKINIDLIRLGIFGKNAIDTKGLQAVGTNLTFYLMKKPTEDIYSMTELDHIRFPTSLNELKGLYGYIDNICDIMNAFSKECSNPVLKEAIMHRSSMMSPLLRAITSKSIDRKRKNSTQHYSLYTYLLFCT
ncbi:hypothetical protein G6F57_010685 [Rhizopus arrhizus]|uniref:Uncharacterized protein n=1 Tax=Rhizopus oryzae TaxID=64495 RepID=A0A9P6XBV6_RHIOR|nr:hypothetical protein G6F23_008714 [Rhizopus arrhizus]KAG0757188.1 hypothetical protein G6F24_010647 [Rhizopus arrhizus]KAG0786526.1 hypothetical protein G6F21_008535 [Rhizopus arrhizus]KAG0828154.1 hypothetical protein G6F18_009217 [Rhizopus arrhizus]KAG0831989.1 hypothetical protein G6F19_006465 [Rhizopus arrhizus]